MAKSYNSYISENINTDYTIKIEDDTYTIKVKDIIEFLNQEQEYYINILNDESITQINGIKKEHFINACVKFYGKSFYGMFDIPEKIKSNYSMLQPLGELLIIKQPNLSLININSNLEHEILKDMPKELTDIEKAIYIYIKMCKLLSYDDEFYVYSHGHKATHVRAMKQSKLEYLSRITPENNKVVCFSFGMIYAKLLEKIGIKFSLIDTFCGRIYQLNNYEIYEQYYGAGHFDVGFSANDYHVSAGAIYGVLMSDLQKAKFNQPLEGLFCLNIDEPTKNKFNNLLEKIYQLINTQENGKNTEQLPSLEELITEYKRTTNNIQEISIMEKFEILFEKISSTNLRGVDALTYILQLRKIMFNETERENKFRAIIVKSTMPTGEYELEMPIVIFSINTTSFEEQPENTIYYVYEKGKPIIMYDRETLEQKFEIQEFKTFGESPSIPGIGGR